MKKVINYKDKEYAIEIKWSGSSYCVRAIGIGGFVSIPSDCFNDIEKIKPYIIESIEKKKDLHVIENWDGNL